MPRPRKTPADQLRALLRARCSMAELAAVRSRAKRSGLTVSQFVRRAVIDLGPAGPGRSAAQGAVHSPANDAETPHRASDVHTSDPIHALVIAVNRAGNLVNQQMPLAHLRGDIPAELLDANRALERALLAVAEHFSR